MGSMSLATSSGSLPKLKPRDKPKAVVSTLPLEGNIQPELRKSDPVIKGGGSSSSESSRISPLMSPLTSPSSLSSSLSPKLNSTSMLGKAASEPAAAIAPVPRPASPQSAPKQTLPGGGPIPALQRQESRDSLSRSGSSVMFPNRSILSKEEVRLGRKGSMSLVLDEATRLRLEGDVLCKKKRPVEALELYNRSLALEPENAATLVSRAVAHLKAENYVAAVVDCDSAISVDPVNGPAFARKAKALLALGRFDEAAESFEKARAIDPKLAELKKMNLADMRNLRNTLKKNSTPGLRVMGSSSALQPKLTGVFGVSLEDLMAAQKFSHPDLVVPEVLCYLMDRLAATGGLRSEGIFRLSIASNELQTHLGKLAAGRRDLETEDPNVYAVLLKHFFRHLPEPLCPDFGACMAVCKDHALHDTSASLRRRKETQSPLLSLFSESTVALLEALWGRMSEHARQSAVLLFRLFNTLLLTEKATKMSLDNLALVFVNGVLRDPDPSAMSALASQPSCQCFVTLLFSFVLESNKGGEERVIRFPLLPEVRREDNNNTAVPPLSRSSTEEVRKKKKKRTVLFLLLNFYAGAGRREPGCERSEEARQPAGRFVGERRDVVVVGRGAAAGLRVGVGSLRFRNCRRSWGSSQEGQSG